MKKALILAVAILVMTSGIAFAKAHCGGKGSYGKSSCKIDKLFHTVKDNQDTLGVSEEQMNEFRAAKVAGKKELIRLGAEKDIAKLDLKVAMYTDEMNAKKINKLIDAKYDIAKKKKKTEVETVINMKSVLSDSQRAQLKDLKKTSKECVR